MARKASLSLMIGWFVVAIAGFAVAGIGFGIAQAGGNHSESPVLSLEGLEALEALEQGSSSSASVLALPSAIDVDYGADGNPSSQSPADSGRDQSYDYGMREHVVSGALPERESDWRYMEALDSYFEYLHENRPISNFEDQELPQAPKSP